MKRAILCGALFCIAAYQAQPRWVGPDQTEPAGARYKTFHEVPGVSHNYRALYDALGEKAFAFYMRAFGKLAPEAKEQATPPKGGAAGEMTVTIGEKTMTVMKSQWADYFGAHYASSPDGAGTAWNTVRSYGGAHTGIHVAENKDAPVRKGPFTGKEIRFQLSDFHGRRGGKSAEQLIPDLIEHRITGIYLMTGIVRPSTEQPFDKDRAYWAVRLIHEKFPKANQQVVWQIGNEVVSGHFDPKGVWRAMTPEEKKKNPMKEDNFFGYDLKWKEDFYVNEYLAPAIEAIERASKDVYGDPRKIRIALGSMNPYNKPNLVFLKNVMERKFDGQQAPTLKGEVVWKHIDLLTAHYMTGSLGTIATLQQYHDDYLKTGKVKGIWITEDHGRAGRGPVTIIDRGLRFLAWAARNNLSGEQTRLCWWGEGERDPGGQGKEATALFGEFFTGRQLYFASQAVTGGTVYTLSDGDHGGVQRLLIALAPERGSSIKLDKLRLKLPPSKTPRQWVVEAIQYSDTTPGKKFQPRSKNIQGGLVIDWGRDVAEPMLLMLKTGR
jgi:hypothetical protein